MNFYEQKERAARAQLDAMLAKPPIPANDDPYSDGECFDPWDLFPSVYGSYSSDFDEMAIEVLKDLRDGTHARTDLAAEMFREMLCTTGLCDYGTSPPQLLSVRRFRREAAAVHRALDRVFRDQMGMRALILGQDIDMLRRRHDPECGPAVRLEPRKNPKQPHQKSEAPLISLGGSRTFNHGVPGSIPGRLTNSINDLAPRVRSTKCERAGPQKSDVRLWQLIRMRRDAMSSDQERIVALASEKLGIKLSGEVVTGALSHGQQIEILRTTIDGTCWHCLGTDLVRKIGVDDAARRITEAWALANKYGIEST
jgi:hypothetical protein